MTYAAVAIGGASLLGGLAGSKSSRKSAKEALQLQREQLAFQKQRYAEYKALYGNTEKLLVDGAEKGVVADLNGVTNRASTDVATQFANAEDTRLRNAARMGINPNSGRADAIATQTGIARSLAASGNITANREAERRNAEQQTWNRRDSVTRLGVNQMNNAAAGMDNAANGMATTLNNQSATQAAQAGQMFSAAGTLAAGLIKPAAPTMAPAVTPTMPVGTTYNPGTVNLTMPSTAIPGIDPNYGVLR